VLEDAFILLEFPFPSRRIFIGSHSLPPLWFAVSVLPIALFFPCCTSGPGSSAGYVDFVLESWEHSSWGSICIMPNLYTLEAGGISRGVSLHWGDNWRHLTIMSRTAVTQSPHLGLQNEGVFPEVD
jgi:hypothetical protein